MAAAPRRMRRWQLTVMLTLAFVRKAAAAEARQQQHEWRLEPLEPSRVLARRGLQQQFGESSCRPTITRLHEQVAKKPGEERQLWCTFQCAPMGLQVLPTRRLPHVRPHVRRPPPPSSLRPRPSPSSRPYVSAGRFHAGRCTNLLHGLHSQGVRPRAFPCCHGAQRLCPSLPARRRPSPSSLPSVSAGRSAQRTNRCGSRLHTPQSRASPCCHRSVCAPASQPALNLRGRYPPAPNLWWRPVPAARPAPAAPAAAAAPLPQLPTPAAPPAAPAAVPPRPSAVARALRHPAAAFPAPALAAPGAPRAPAPARSAQPALPADSCGPPTHPAAPAVAASRLRR